MIGISVSVPKDLLDIAAFERTILNGVNGILNDTLVDVKATYATWDAEDKPTVEKEAAHKSGDGITGAIKIDGDIWNLVDVGADPHPITAHRFPTLVFQESYTPKTTVHTMGSKGGRSSGAWVRKVSVEHPGFEGRDFVNTIQKEHADELLTVATQAVEEVSPK